ncbi:MAG: 16S rRNA processing protein RimM [Deltaproteobacteria bacterium]|nr:16S rRNA processing protein RimM [Deltaproteobacteria bacterium]
MSKEAGLRTDLMGLGKISGVHGLKGTLKIQPDADSATTDPEVIQALGEVVIAGKAYPVLKAERFKNQVLIQLQGISNRDQAEALVGRKVEAERRRFPRLPEGEYYWFQVLGLTVLNAADGGALGQLAEIIPTPAHDVYVVRQGAREVLLPAIEEVIAEINLEEGWIKVTPPPGLLD